MSGWLVVGLGNPGPEYRETRHNVGFRVVDRLIEGLNARPASSLPSFDLWNAVRPEGEIYLIKPMTFMNLSGVAVSDFLQFRSLPLSRIMIVFDDVALPLGSLRLRPSGSGGGHRGMSHIIDALGSTDIPRLRLGIDAPRRPGQPLRDFVLEPFGPAECQLVNRLVDRAAAATRSWFCEKLSSVMGRFNGPLPPDPHDIESGKNGNSNHPGPTNSAQRGNQIDKIG